MQVLNLSFGGHEGSNGGISYQTLMIYPQRWQQLSSATAWSAGSGPRLSNTSGYSRTPYRIGNYDHRFSVCSVIGLWMWSVCERFVYGGCRCEGRGRRRATRVRRSSEGMTHSKWAWNRTHIYRWTAWMSHLSSASESKPGRLCLIWLV